MLTTLKNLVKPSVDHCFSLLGYRHCLTSDFTIDSTPRSNVLSLIESLHPVGVSNPLIRLGPKDSDGGYLIPDDLNGISACYSPGVSYVSGFEKDCAELGMKVFMADHSVDAPAEHHENFHFIKKFVGGTTFAKYITLDDWVRETLPNGDSDLLLQMDIEGQEYETLFSTSDKLMRRFRIIAIEFHNLDQFWNLPFFQIASRAFEKILQTHACVHLHPNNCCGSIKKDGLEIPKFMEFTFLRRDRFKGEIKPWCFPNPLDRDNTKMKTLKLPECWYR
jgi:hypothetical protein